MPDKIFTLDEVNRLIVELRPLVSKMREIWNELQEMQPEMQAVCERARYDAGCWQGEHYVKQLLRLNDLVRRITSKGVLIKDLGRGLCDFPHEMNGRIVYLCWELGEEEVEWWHEVSDGYAGRRPLLAEEE